MVRQRTTPRTVTSNRSILEDEEDWNEFVKRFRCLYIKRPIDIVGCKSSILAIRRDIEWVIKKSSTRPIFSLVTGPHGVGKTTIIRKLAQEYTDAAKLSFFYIDINWIHRTQFGNPETRLRSLCEEALTKSPSLIHIANFDCLNTEKKNSISSIFVDIFDDFLVRSTRVIVLAESKDQVSIDQKLLYPPYFTTKIKFGLPTSDDRLDYCTNCLAGIDNSLSEEELNQLVQNSHCYSFGDLDEVFFQAKRITEEAGLSKVNFESLKAALQQHKPLAIRTYSKPIQPLRWDQIGGVEHAKRKLQQFVIGPLKHRQKFIDKGVSTIKGAILYGPPGCSKSMLGRALATESGYNFKHIKATELVTKYVGESESKIRDLYQTARDIAPCIIFIDEIDGLTPDREDEHNSVGSRIVSTMLCELDEAGADVFTIGATNLPHRIDAALMRPGRLECLIYVPLPSKHDRAAIFKIHLSSMDVKFDKPIEDVIQRLVSLTEGYSGADIVGICRTAGTNAIFEVDEQPIQWKHFELALTEVKPRTSNDRLEAFKKFQEIGPVTSSTSSGKKSTTHIINNRPETNNYCVKCGHTEKTKKNSIVKRAFYSILCK